MFKHFRSAKLVKNLPHKNGYRSRNTRCGEPRIGVASSLTKYLMVTNFRKNPRGSGFFCVEMTWNDPWQTLSLVIYRLNHQIAYTPPNISVIRYLGEKLECLGWGGGGGGSFPPAPLDIPLRPIISSLLCLNGWFQLIIICNIFFFCYYG